MDDLGVRFLYNVVKEYPDMIKITIYHEPKCYIIPDRAKRSAEKVNDDVYTPSVSSLSRTKTLIKDIIICNEFEYFCTFTFDPKKVDSYNFCQCRRVMSIWLHHQRDVAREKGKIFKYIIVPEQHKSGRWHFHALISGYCSTMKKAKVTTNTGRPIYNITSFRSGFTTASPIDDFEAVGAYVSKYITKDFIRKFNTKRFIASRNLIRPIKKSNTSLFAKTLPLFRQKVAGNDYYTQYRLPYGTNSGGLAPLDRPRL